MIRLEILLSERILNVVNKGFFLWETHYGKIKLQYESYQCGVWCSFFVNVYVCVCVCVFVKYLKSYKNSVNISQSTAFLNTIKDGLFQGCSRIGGGARRPLLLSKICQTSCNDETWYSHTLPKEDPKIYEPRDTPHEFW